MRTKHFDQALVLHAVLVNRPELVATGSERGTRGMFERGDRGVRLNASIDQIFSQRADDAIAPGIYLANLLWMLACSLQKTTGGSVDNCANAARLGIKCILTGHGQLPTGR